MSAEDQEDATGEEEACEAYVGLLSEARTFAEDTLKVTEDIGGWVEDASDDDPDEMVGSLDEILGALHGLIRDAIVLRDAIKKAL